MSAALLAPVLAALAAAPAPNTRYALVVGVGAGDAEDETLKHAGSDARRVADALVAVGGFEPENVTTLIDVSADELSRALASIAARVPDDGVMFVFYSGHADAAALHLQGTHLALDALKAAVAGAKARARVLVIDACRSGSVTRVKGGRKEAGFDVTISGVDGSEGLAVLTSSASGEDSQESDTLAASFFTHYFTSALLGAADRNHDGDVTLSEAFAYTKERTLTATAGTRAGPQHPTFENQLKGRDELVLSRPGRFGRRQGRLSLEQPGWYVISRHRDDAVVAEVLTDDGASALALEAGRYRVLKREARSLLTGEVEVTAGAAVSLEPSRFNREPYARVVRKGGTERTTAVAAFAGGGARGSLSGLGLSWVTEAGVRLELSKLALELRLSFGRGATANERLAFTTDELGASVVVWFPFDLGPITLAGGLSGGASVFWQRFTQLLPSAAQDRVVAGGVVSPLAGIQVPLGSRVHLRAEAAMPIYVISVGNLPGQQALSVLPTWRAAAGLGVEF